MLDPPEADKCWMLMEQVKKVPPEGAGGDL